MQATEMSLCTNFEWQTVWLMQGSEEGSEGSLGRLLWRERASPSPGQVVVRKDTIRRWEVASLLLPFSQSCWVPTRAFSPGGERIKYSKHLSLPSCCHYPQSGQGSRFPWGLLPAWGCSDSSYSPLGFLPLWKALLQGKTEMGATQHEIILAREEWTMART